MNAEIQDLIRRIKTDFRLSMNGIASKTMRESGLNYKLNFGIELPRLRQIADDYEPSHDLAQELWKDDVRESKILATMLQPIDTFYPEIADIWVERMPTYEMADIAVMNLFQRLPYASDKAFVWISTDDDMMQYCGWILLARLLMRGAVMSDDSEAEFLDQLGASLSDANHYVQRAARLAAQKYALQGEEQERKLKVAQIVAY